MNQSLFKNNPLLRHVALDSLALAVRFATLVVIATVVITLSAFAQDTKPDIQASTQIHKIKMIDGKDTYITTPVISLDDVVQYTMDYHNASEKSLSNVQVTFKVPKDMHYVSGSMNTSPTHAKTSGDVEWNKYPVLEFVSGRPQEISASSYDAFAWTIQRIEPKQTVRIVLRTKLVQRPSIQ